MWPGGARAAGIAVDTTPRAGDVAIWDIGAFGHAMYVESVNKDGTINISQYNADYYGHFSYATVSTSGLQFIHF
jgi:surface antigen